MSHLCSHDHVTPATLSDFKCGCSTKFSHSVSLYCRQIQNIVPNFTFRATCQSFSFFSLESNNRRLGHAVGRIACLSEVSAWLRGFSSWETDYHWKAQLWLLILLIKTKLWLLHWLAITTFHLIPGGGHNQSLLIWQLSRMIQLWGFFKLLDWSGSWEVKKLFSQLKSLAFSGFTAEISESVIAIVIPVLIRTHGNFHWATGLSTEQAVTHHVNSLILADNPTTV